MAYSPTTWVEGVTTVGPTNMNHLEGGVATADTNATSALTNAPSAAVVKSVVTTAGDLIYATGNAAVTRLGIGSSSQTLKGGASAPAWGLVALSELSGYPSDATKFARGDGTWAVPVAPTNPVNFLTFSGQSIASAITANAAYYMPIVVMASFTATSVKWQCGTQSGNYDIGIYDSAFARVWSKGSTTCPAAGPVTVTIASGTPSSLTLTAGVYYLAFAFDNGTAQVHVTTGAQAAAGGFAYTKATSFVLPSSLSGGVTPSASGHGVWLGLV